MLILLLNDVYKEDNYSRCLFFLSRVFFNLCLYFDKHQIGMPQKFGGNLTKTVPLDLQLIQIMIMVRLILKVTIF